MFKHRKKTVVTIGGKNSGSISKTAIIAAEKLKVDNSTQGIEYFVMYWEVNGQRTTLTSYSSSLTQEMKNAINGFTKPTKVTFADVVGHDNSNVNQKYKLGSFSISIE